MVTHFLGPMDTFSTCFAHFLPPRGGLSSILRGLLQKRETFEEFEKFSSLKIHFFWYQCRKSNNFPEITQIQILWAEKRAFFIWAPNSQMTEVLFVCSKFVRKIYFFQWNKFRISSRDPRQFELLNRLPWKRFNYTIWITIDHFVSLHFDSLTTTVG